MIRRNYQEQGFSEPISKEEEDFYRWLELVYTNTPLRLVPQLEERLEKLKRRTVVDLLFIQSLLWMDEAERLYNKYEKKEESIGEKLGQKRSSDIFGDETDLV